MDVKGPTPKRQPRLDSESNDQGKKITHQSAPHSIQIPSKLERRRTLTGIMLLFLFIYIPRIQRIEDYLLASTKQKLQFPIFTLSLKQTLSKNLNRFEDVAKRPFNVLDSPDRLAVITINHFLEKVNCPPSSVNSIVEHKPGIGGPELARFQFICRYAITRAFRADYTKRAITVDGHILLYPNDTVFLAGDSLMQGPAPLIAESLKNRGVNVINASRISTGLSYPQFFNWNAAIKKIIDEKKAKVVIVFLGANDTFDIYQGNSLAKIGTQNWSKIYGSRIADISHYAKLHNVALLWLGLPAMNRSDIQPHIHLMNQLYKKQVLRFNGLYIRTDNLLGNNEASFTPFKIINGYQVRTRSDDGVHFTPDGWMIIAKAVVARFKFS